MFTKVIANPPYGKRGTLATTIIKSFIKTSVEKCLVFSQTYEYAQSFQSNNTN